MPLPWRKTASIAAAVVIQPHSRAGRFPSQLPGQRARRARSQGNSKTSVRYERAIGAGIGRNDWGLGVQPITPPTGKTPMPPGRWLFAGPGAALATALGILALWGAVDTSRLVHTGGHVGLVRVIAAVIGVLLTALGIAGFAALLLAGNRLPRYVVDEQGIALWSARGSDEVPWTHLAGVGVGYKVSPRVSLARWREGFALELFPTDPDLRAAYPRAGQLIVVEDPPRPGLPGSRLRLVLADYGVERDVGAAVSRYAPALWLGRYRRRWRRMPGA